MWHGEIAYWRGHVARDLRLLAVKTSTSPSAHILADGGPNNLRANGLSSPLDTRVSESVDGIEDLLPECIRYKWSGRTITYVHD